MTKEKEKEDQSPKKSKFKAFFTRKNIFISVVVVLLFIQYIQIGRVFGTFSLFDKKDSSLIKEIGQVKESYTQIGNDLNEVRDFLRMPKTNYGGFAEPEDKEETDKNKDDVQIALFKYVDSLAVQQNLENKVNLYKSFLQSLNGSENFKKFLTEQGLTRSSLSEDDSNVSFKVLGPANENLFFFYLSKEDGKLFVKTVNIKQEIASKDAAEFEKSTIDTIKLEKDALIVQVRSLNEKQKFISDAIKAKATQDVIKKLGIKLDGTFIDKDLKITYSIFNKSGELAGEIVLDSKTLEISLVDKNDESTSLIVTDVSSALPPFLEKLDTKSFVEKKADKAIQQVENTLKDEGFKQLMSQSGLKISEKVRTDEDRIYYDIYDKNDTHISSLVIEKATGVINIVQPNGTNAQNLLFMEESKKKTIEIPNEIPDYGETSFSDDHDFNILIAGKHGSLVDTMIFAHIDEEKGTIRMVSVPRDLFYNGRKINAFAHYYGMPELKKVLSSITGYELDKYILIDMYAFIDVIDLIGGIDIHLDSPVIDPTYRTVDNGKEGTLYYEPGDYHLGGKEALRLARTRHTSSDFARAERQQKILEALQNKARNFGFGDADTIYEIAKTVLNKTETDIGLDEAIAYYFRYQNYKIMSNDVMSSGNVLYVPPYITTENCQQMIETAAAAGQPKPDCENENHAYTLLPLNNNWNVVKWFFKQKFEAAGEEI